MIVFYILLAALVALLLVVLIRTAAFKPKAQPSDAPEALEYDGQAAVDALGQLVRCKTVSYYDKAMEDDGEFEKLIALLPVLYPHVSRTCPLTKLPDRGLLYHWQGKEPGPAAVLMAHYDVVPVDEANWDKPAFEALIEDGIMWGRGTLDTKVTFNGILSAAENLICQGFQPRHDVYFAFSGGEEVNGLGAVNIVNYFRDHQIELSMVVDEGGGVVRDVFPGVAEPCALIGIAEKGLMNLEFSVSGGGGHASAPAPHTPVGRLSLACAKLEAKPFKAHFSKPVLEMFDTLGRHSTFVYRMIFANLWLFGGILDRICKKSGGELNALLRTTVAFTQMSGSPAPNVIPPRASMVANLRLNPEDSVAGALEYIKGVIGDPEISLTDQISMEPSPVSRTDCEGWHKVCTAVSHTWPGSLVAPYLMVQCSDSRHYGPISDKVYRFSAMALTSEERRTIHGNNEHISLDAIRKAVEFFMRLMKQC